MKPDGGKKVLIVDDEQEMRIALETTLKREGFECTCASDGQEALDRCEREIFDLVLTDVKMPRLGGLELLRGVKRQAPQTFVIMMTAYGDIDNAVETMKEGAFDYLLKPFSAEVLLSAVNRAFRSEPSAAARPAPLPRPEDRSFLTRNEAMKKLLHFVENIAYSKSTVLIQGETGTGKELIARHIHQCSPRGDQPFMAINCAALPEGLLETELFGHEKGAFTGATYRKEGKFELAHKGTLLLDEVTEMSLPLQAKLLRVLQEHEIDKVGGRDPIPVDVRVIATTNRDLKQRIQNQQFREDLYYRLNVIPIRLLSLRERKEDIPLLAEHFLKIHSRENSKTIDAIDEATLALLRKYHWPGNVRELANIIERAVLICQTDTLMPSHLFFDPDAEWEKSEANAAGPLPFRGTIYEMEKALILQTLQEMNGNRTRAAESLGISIRTLRNKLTEYQKNKEQEPSTS
ncbi:MAG: response regulator [Nitrospinaceae bacterium]|nr:sigma-54-dependent Fis family transcriptional regulator [Nitrospinaceae bacterium]NIR57456.1 sigma-54-dependent Fis family transcriptional regulator [Nitrospinaceae bacterium]NIS87923.1 sigma-54-dependent Fis family transcriptional regulator [Nitrospinaceae bacterium]NIT84791.1 sigma-54-dependent Fis family transcriptional regulator [Nitrospinaceae bacterium]NIU46967.1 sigma-54-dependent Fis family transcriptional regulator [Nitrospinaceae bacterium]